MNEKNYLVDHTLAAKRLVADYHNHRVEAGIVVIDVDDCYVVWFAKTLQNWKALVTTVLPDGRYYEVTYNGDHEEAYIDVYEKVDNTVVEGNFFNNTPVLRTNQGARN